MKKYRYLWTVIFSLCFFVPILGSPYEWRGCMIDVSRHFFDTQFLKKQIDILSNIGINTLHLHLTDAGGWRIQIKNYPKLTSYAAWRTESDWDKWWNQNDRKYLLEGTEGAYGGYYTQSQMKDLVQYALQKGITIVPEIEMPGHSEEVLAAYPELKCQNNFSSQSDLCPSNPKTYSFLYQVLKEITDIFPSTYIHLGGDEAGKEAWKNCPRCQDMAKRLHLSSTDELQDIFMRKMTQYIEQLGRKPVVWDEALTDSLSPNTVIMIWRDQKTAQKALQKGYSVVLSPTSHCYLDYYQDAPFTQPRAFGGYLPFDTVCSLPLLKGIKGLQGNLWTEYITTPQHAEYMLYPRMLAIALLAMNQQPSLSISMMRKKAMIFVNSLHTHQINAFNLKKEYGQRKDFNTIIKHKGLNKKITYLHPYSPYYVAQGNKTLLDGKRGGWQHGDKRWQGFIGDSCFHVVIDLGKVQKIKQISLEFMQSDVAWIFPPKSLRISISKDGMNYQELKHFIHPKVPSSILTFCAMQWKGKEKTRYIKILGESTTKNDWIFTDEIIIQ